MGCTDSKPKNPKGNKPNTNSTINKPNTVSPTNKSGIKPNSNFANPPIGGQPSGIVTVPLPSHPSGQNSSNIGAGATSNLPLNRPQQQFSNAFVSGASSVTGALSGVSPGVPPGVSGIVGGGVSVMGVSGAASGIPSIDAHPVNLERPSNLPLTKTNDSESFAMIVTGGMKDIPTANLTGNINQNMNEINKSQIRVPSMQIPNASFGADPSKISAINSHLPPVNFSGPISIDPVGSIHPEMPQHIPSLIPKQAQNIGSRMRAEALNAVVEAPPSSITQFITIIHSRSDFSWANQICDEGVRQESFKVNVPPIIVKI